MKIHADIESELFMVLKYNISGYRCGSVLRPTLWAIRSCISAVYGCDSPQYLRATQMIEAEGPSGRLF